MSAPHLRRRYRTAGSRRGLVYLFVLVAVSALYVSQRVNTGRKQFDLDSLRQSLATGSALAESLRARRDSLASLAAISSRAAELGLHPAGLAQLSRLPLSAPVLQPSGYSQPAQPFQIAGAMQRLWHWLDGAAPRAQEAHAAR